MKNIDLKKLIENYKKDEQFKLPINAYLIDGIFPMILFETKIKPIII